MVRKKITRTQAMQDVSFGLVFVMAALNFMYFVNIIYKI